MPVFKPHKNYDELDSWFRHRQRNLPIRWQRSRHHTNILAPTVPASFLSRVDLQRQARDPPRSVARARCRLAGFSSEQLALIRRLWKPLLGDSLERFLLMAGEILREEELAIWMQLNPKPSRRARPPSATGVQASSSGLRLSVIPRFRFSAIPHTNTKSSRPTPRGCPARC